jgi:hypothetical protein
MRTKNGILVLVVFFAFFGLTHSSMAATFSGANSPGYPSEFSFTIGAGEEPLRINVPVHGEIESQILLKYGSPLVSESDFQYASVLKDFEHVLELGSPDLIPGQWYVWVYTPPSAPGIHPFTLYQQTGIEAQPEDLSFKLGTASASLDSSGRRFYRVAVPVDQEGWRIVLSATGSSNIILRKDGVSGPTVASNYYNALHTLLLSPGDLTGGTVYYLEVYANEALSCDLTSDLVYMRELQWDEGVSPEGTQAMLNPDGIGGDYLFRITSQDSNYGACATA